MTQPIQEPSTDRALQGFAYARDQIFRRPAPAGEASIFEYAIVSGLNDDPITVPTATWTPIPGANLFSTCMTVGPMEYIEVGEPASNDFELRVREPCYCLVSIHVEWTTDFQSDKACNLITANVWHPGASNPIFALPFLGRHSHCGSPLEASFSPGGGPLDVTLEVWQNSGVNRFVTGSTGISIAVISNLPDPVFC